MIGKSRPMGGSQTPAKKSTAIVTPTSAVVLEAESILLLEAMARGAVADLTTGQLRSLVWVGLTDDAWKIVLAELDRRGEDL